MIHSLYTLLCILLSQIDTMSFHASASNIELEDGHILKATLRTEDGEEQESTIDLNDHIGNDNGHFHWDGGDFHSSAEDISFDLEGDDNVPILRATLTDVDGNGNSADLNLSERIGNDNGQLVFI
ncbi:Cyanovirin-N [Penicillium cf. griseofulvum]|uniref:Cyanovirin-N n=1 Tax=Penicillium cf. griseofulvum TaxID=2972120 RepID=A0A9W9LX81_9EURO|nr:Cyanovirin-N [Penicillium cf. griseofulvum]KAJ5442967.1 Cyanovirin-N [Penicillium cf. griseofulvum]KAJ5451624.1 Cyanovirin-N [Penicillium cf. griseofulvum]